MGFDTDLTLGVGLGIVDVVVGFAVRTAGVFVTGARICRSSTGTCSLGVVSTITCSLGVVSTGTVSSGDVSSGTCSVGTVSSGLNFCSIAFWMLVGISFLVFCTIEVILVLCASVIGSILLRDVSVPFSALTSPDTLPPLRRYCIANTTAPIPAIPTATPPNIVAVRLS